MPGLGRGKIDRLLAILAGAPPAAAIPWPRVFDRLGISEAFPLALMPLPARLREFCHEGAAATLGSLLRLYERQGGEAALPKIRNLGRGTAATANQLYEAARNGDETVLGKFLPLRPGGGLYLAEGISLLLRGAEEVQRTVLRARLLEGRTLGKIGFELGLSTERVRQLERDLLQSTAALLDWFAAERDACFARFESQEPCAEMFTSMSEEDHLLAQAMVRRVFDVSPTGAAHAEMIAVRHSRWLGELQADPEFYLGSVVFRDWVAGRGGGEQALASFAALCCTRFTKPAIGFSRSTRASASNISIARKAAADRNT